MAAIKTDSNQPEILSDAEFQRAVLARLDHLDEQLHEIRQFIDEHKPALARGMALLDPGAKIRSALGRKPR